jgi:8-oxo-dGTP pyrophosphatase MutT (NUDIX family)
MGDRVDIVRTAGGLLWRRGPRALELAIIHRSRQGDWTLPKGKLECGESWRAAALREVHEETGCTARLRTFAGATSYEVRRGLKIVLYWNMEVVRRGALERLHEVDEVAWLSPEEALKRLDHARERRVIERALAGRAPVRDVMSVVARVEAAIARGDVERARRLVHVERLSA